MKEHKTVGQMSAELKQDSKQGVIDTQREMNKKFIPEIEKCIKNHKDWTEPFYIIVINKRERLMVNVIRQYFIARKTLPTEDYDQTVFKYDPTSCNLEFLWTVPDVFTVNELLLHKNNLPEDHRRLVEFCWLFKNGRLAIIHGK